MVHYSHNVVVYFPTPIVPNVFGEFLAVSVRSPGIWHDDHVPSGCEYLSVPAVGPTLSPVAFGSAVDQKQNRVLLIRLKARRLDDKALNAGLLCTLHPELIERRQLILRQQSIIEMSKRHRRSASGCRAENLTRCGPAF